MTPNKLLIKTWQDEDIKDVKIKYYWDYLRAFLLTSLIFGALMASCQTARASGELIEGYSVNTWAEAIHKAEGNDNYGILVKFKHTSPKQACINTIKHKYALWTKSGRKGAFLTYLGARYCPIGASNDPTGLNKNWIANVKYWLERIG